MPVILHTADLHFSNNTEKLVEVVRTTNFMLERAIVEKPDCIVIAGDTLDEFDGRIRLDSECARAAISFIERAADIAPVIIIRGTKSHDRESPYLFQHLHGFNPIHVACDVEMVALGLDRKFTTVDTNCDNYLAVFTLIPQLDKTYMSALDSIRSGNMAFKEAIHDLFAGFGIINTVFTSKDIPTILVTHGMLTGCSYSSGQVAIGDDLEFSLNDLHSARTTYTALGHVHKYQEFPGDVVYCGSPGRLNFGEQEEKGFVFASFSDAECTNIEFIKTPARRFCIGEVPIYIDAKDVYARAYDLAIDCKGADVRFRLQVPEEHRADIDHDRLEQIFLIAGANKVKLEISVIPKQRTRAAGISSAVSLSDKVLRWAETVGETVPADVLAMASIIEGMSIDELLATAQIAIDTPSIVPVVTSVIVTVPNSPEVQASLFS